VDLIEERRVVQALGEPDVANPPTAGRQQLAHRPAPLHLLGTQSPALAPGGVAG
jgi:hypothetical protein